MLGLFGRRWSRIVSAVVASGIIAGCAAPSSPTPAKASTPPTPLAQVTWYAPERIVDDKPIRAANTERFGVSVRLAIVTEPSGVVYSVEVLRGDRNGADKGRWEGIPDSLAPVFAAARARAVTWRYRPVLRNGQAVAVSFQETVEVYPRERPVVRRVPWPDHVETGSVRIGVDRGRYAFEIDGNGVVTYEGRQSVRIPGYQSGRVDSESAMRLFKMFRDSEFLSLDDNYLSQTTDIGSYKIYISINSLNKQVVYDDYSAMEGMPDAAIALGVAIEEISGAARWAEGNSETIDILKGRGFDFTSPIAGVLLEDALQYGRWDFAMGLLSAGAPLERVGWRSLATRNSEIAVAVVEAAVKRGSLKDRTAALGTASQLGDLALLQRLLSLRADPNGNSHDGDGALFDVYSATAARLLINAGADINAKDAVGRTPLLWAGSEDAALELLAAGADPNAIGCDGVSVADRARALGWTRLLARLGG